jgi:hypothetical protein
MEQDMCVDADAWAKAFMEIKKEADLHEVSLWFSSCLSTAFMHGQQSPRYASLQQGHPSRNNGTSYSPLPSSVAA